LGLHGRARLPLRLHAGVNGALACGTQALLNVAGELLHAAIEAMGNAAGVLVNACVSSGHGVIPLAERAL